MTVADEVGSLTVVTARTARAFGADEAVVRTLDQESGRLVARHVWASSPALAAHVLGTGVSPEEIEWEGAAGADRFVVRRPVVRDGETLGSLELVRDRPFDAAEAALLELGALQVGLVIAGAEEGPAAQSRRETMLQLACRALEAGSAAGGSPERIARLAAEVTGAFSSLLWSASPGGGLEPAAAHAFTGPVAADLQELAQEALQAPGPVSVERDIGPGESRATVATVRLGEPALGILQLFFQPVAAPRPSELSSLAGFGARAAHALSAGETARRTAEELERTRILLSVVGEAAARLSLSHTLETTVARISELLGIERVAIYLREGRELDTAAERGLAGPHARVADELLGIALGSHRGRTSVWIADAAGEPSLERARPSVSEAGIEAVFAVPLVARDEVIGLLAVYPRRGRPIGESEAALVTTLAPQLAVAVQNARLHERTKELGAELESALEAERQAARRLRALYEVSRSFTQSLSLEATLEAITRTLVDELEVDGAALRMLDARREELEVRSIHVAQEHLADSLRAVLARPHPIDIAPVRRLLRSGMPLVLDASIAANLPGYELLAPFLEKGGTAVILPLATPVEVVATATLISFDPTRPITAETIDVALSIAGQVALAIDNARLYQQQKGLADTMQRALLTRTEPEIDGFEIGAIYESSARVDVGGDIYDFAELGNGRLAVVLGDVTGHGIEAAADMAMAKYVFRSLSREHPEPADFLAAANEVVLGEMAPGKFITMLYLTVDPRSGTVSCASAGHPGPRVLAPDGRVSELAMRGLPLGVEAGESFEEVAVTLEPGSTVVLHTDGVVEARSGREQYGTDRLDDLLRAHAGSSARELASAIVADSRRFAGGQLPDDCAVVVLRRTG